MLRGTVCVASIAWAMPVLADDSNGFDLSGTVRLRYEVIANQPRVG
jgi:hypothetical protein